MTTDNQSIPSVAREAANREAVDEYPEIIWSRMCERLAFADGAAWFASRLPSEEELAEALKPIISEHHGTNENGQWWVSDHASDYARAVLALWLSRYKRK